MKQKILVLLMAVLLIVSGCSARASKDGINEAGKPVTVSTSIVQRTKIEKVQTVTGKAKPVKDITIVPKVPGKVAKVYVNLGDEVKKGQTLFTIDDKEIRLQVAQAEASLNMAKANLDRSRGGAMELQMAQLESSLNTAQINLNDAKKMYEDTKALYENGMASKQNLDSAETRYKIAVEQYYTAKKAKELTETKINNENLASSRAQVKQAEAAYELAKSQLENTTVVSPEDGIVSALNIDEGELVSSAVAAVSIVDISSIIVDVNVMENIVNKLSMGQRYDVLIKSVKEEPFLGEVISISPNADPRTQAYLTRVRVANSQNIVKGGMVAEVRVVTEEKDNIIAVPLECVVDENGKKVIYIVEGDKALKREISTGVSDEKFVEIIGDVKEGDKVIVKGQNFVKDNSKVIVVD
ncbi:MAG: efflux RND transporter periplasmic adaptor subunit [Bacillota bacterium]